MQTMHNQVRQKPTLCSQVVEIFSLSSKVSPPVQLHQNMSAMQGRLRQDAHPSRKMRWQC
eukprot:7134553-Karenia_brevis.AAC.1